MVKISRANFLLKTFGITKIPMIAFTNPKIIELDQNKVVVRVRKNWRTKNHFNSMYFGAMAVGADITAAFLAFLKGKESEANPSIVFKDFSASFIKRPDSDVFFECTNGLAIDQMIRLSAETKERVTEPAKVLAYTHYYDNRKELVAEMTLGLSIKVKA